MRHKALPLLCGLLLAGCAMVGPDYKRPDTGLPASYAEPAPNTGALSVPERWWTLYNDPVLNDLVESGLRSNSDLRLAVARVEEAEGLLREAHAVLFFPLIQGSAGATRGRNLLTGTGNAYTLGVSTSFEIDVWGRLRRAERVTVDNLLATQYARDTVSMSVAATIARTYFIIRALDSQYKASDEISRVAGESYDLARKRAEGGVAAELDVYQASSLHNSALAQTKEIGRQRALILHQLAVLSGKYDLALPAGDVRELPIPPLPPVGLPSELLERRPDVRQAEATLAGATERIGVARGAQFPALSLTAAFGQQSPELNDLFASQWRVWSFGLNLLGPIIDGGRYAARTEQAEAQARQAQASYQKTVETSFREVSDALSNVRHAAATDTDLQAWVADARRVLHLSQLRYERGYSAYLEVLDAQRTLNSAALEFLRNRQAYLSYTVDLMNALGGGWKDTEAVATSK
jgi:multidrug efflux system outer membrane protein